MCNAQKKFQELLRELFQFDCADLDFGLYRIMNHKRGVIEKFITQELPKAITEELDRGALAEQSQATKELKKVAEQIRNTLGKDALDAEGNLAETYSETPLGKKYLDLKEKAAGSRDREALQATIFNHLYTFFSRYYQDGDFISKRRYSKHQKYAIPYNGEEVYLYWANHDQYYIKTAEHFHDYTFSAHGVTVHFKLVQADVEQNNVKGDKRLFLPHIEEINWDEENNQIVIPFEYRPLTEQEAITYGKRKQQENIIKDALEEIPKRLSPQKAAQALAALTAERHKTADGKSVSFLEHHLRQYTRRNTSDFFIHKDLKGFLTRELDFYLKNEVLNLDEIEAAGEEHAQGWFQMMRVIKAIGGRIIEFLAQIEDFQKMLWEKRKFITETQYCITVGNIHERFYPDIAAVDAQWDEWKELFHIDEEEAGLFTSDKGRKDRRIAFLKTHPTLVLDTRHFDQDFVDRLLASFDDLNEMTDGLLIHSENFQALNFIENQVSGKVSNIFIDPPYNTGDDGFVYKDGYGSSTWLSMIEDRVEKGIKLLSNDGVFFVSIGDEEQEHLATLLRQKYGKSRFFATLIWEKKKKGSFLSGKIARMKDYILCVAKQSESFSGLIGEITSDIETYPCINASNPREIRHIPPGIVSKYREKDFIKKSGDVISAGNMNLILKSDLVIKNGILADELVIEGNWRYSQASMEKYAAKKELYITQDLYLRRIVKKPRYKRMKDLLPRVGSQGESDFRAYDINDLSKYGWGTNEDANDELHQIIGEQYAVSYPKPSKLLTLLLVATRHKSGYWIDYFSGSGTTGHAVINLNREDGGRRKFILVEMGNYFDTVLLPRIKKIAFTPEWEDGKPKRLATQEEAKRSPRIVKIIRLESYEDTLNNIEFEETTSQRVLDFDDYLLQYMLKWETRKSETFLNIEKLSNPFSYRLRIHADGQTREKVVDIPETFNYLLGLHVKTRRALYDGDRRYLVYRGRIDHREVVIIWRENSGWTKEDLERDKKFVAEQKLTEGADEVFVNGDSFIRGAKALEPVFKARMFAPVEG